MKHAIFRPLGTLFCSALLLGALSIPAQAANNITVKVDDQAVAFTDAYPLLRNDRTYVPFRAIFEQMDANVTWDNATQTVTATRDGRNVRFQIGKTDVTITEDGQTQTISTDAAPFIEGSRTYVPVRFASEAFGACVDWVQSTQTVLIVDVASLADDAYAASFGRMDQYLDFTAPDTTQAVQGDFSFDMQYKAAMGNLPVRLTGTVSGSSNADASELAGQVQTDVTALREAIEKNEGADVIDSEIESLLKSLANTSYQAIFSRADGTLYLSGALMTELGAASDGWMAFPFDSFAGQAGGSLLAAPAEDHFADTIASLAQQLDLEGAPNATVQTVRTFLEQTKATYGDTAFQASGSQAVLSANGYRITLTYGANGAVERAQVTGQAQADGATYTLETDQTTSNYTLTLSVQGGSSSDLSMKVTLTTADGGTSPNSRPSGPVTNWN
ncbi:MAG: stalk domain-containing protein [Butyricicoccus sp.]|nr:stalk domain-containing protein [Butyricicoccus sp.]